MNFIKERRSKLGLTQIDLVDKSGLSLRTIQRAESVSKAPKGHTLTKIAEALKVSTEELLKHYQDPVAISDQERQVLKYLNLSILTFCVIPFGNLIVPLWMWNKNRTLEHVHVLGKAIINLQIMWTLFMMAALVVSPFIGKGVSTDTPLIMWTLLIVVLINLFLVMITALRLSEDPIDLIDPPISFL